MEASPVKKQFLIIAFFLPYLYIYMKALLKLLRVFFYPAGAPAQYAPTRCATSVGDRKVVCSLASGVLKPANQTAIGSKMLSQTAALCVKGPSEEAYHLRPQRVPQVNAPGEVQWLAIGER